jgi:hypothetical protein
MLDDGPVRFLTVTWILECLEREALTILCGPRKLNVPSCRSDWLGCWRIVEKEVSQSSKLSNDLTCSVSSSKSRLAIAVAVVELLATSVFEDKL